MEGLVGVMLVELLGTLRLDMIPGASCIDMYWFDYNEDYDKIKMKSGL